MVRSNVWMSNESQPIYTIEMDKFDNFCIVNWFKSGNGYEGKTMERVYDLVDAKALLHMYFHDYIQALNNLDVQ